MKKILTTLVLVVILAACGHDPVPTPPPVPSPYFGDELKLSGGVYTRKINFDPEDIDSENIYMSLLPLLIDPSGLITYPDADKNLDLLISDNGLGGSGKIKNGNFSYSVGNPPSNALLPLQADDIPDISAIYTDVSITPQNANAAFLYLSTDNPDYPLLTRENIVLESAPSMSIKITAEITTYIYVDKNITISAQGSSVDRIIPIPIDDETSWDIPVKLNTQNINLNLRTGWNAIHSTFTVTIKPTTSLTIEAEGNVSFSVGNPSSLNWVLTSEDEFSSFY